MPTETPNSPLSDKTEDVNYYTRIEGDEAGPFSRPRVTRMFRDGTLAEHDQIRSGERGEWMPIEVHPVFTAIRTATARPDTLPQTDAQYNAAGTASAPPGRNRDRRSGGSIRVVSR